MPKSDHRGPGDADARHRASGNVAIVVALSLLLLALTVGAAVDLTLAMRARTITREGIDAGLMAGIRAMHLEGLAPDAGMQAAQQAYAANVVNRGSVVIDSIAFQPADEMTAVVAVGSARMPTRILRLIGITSLPLVGADPGKAIRTVGVNAVQSLESALAVATPARLDAEAIGAVQAAASAFAGMIVWDERNGHSSRLALVPFASGVAVGPLIGLVARPPAPVAVFAVAGGRRQRLLQSGCVAERGGSAAATDAPPSLVPLSAVFTATGLCDPRTSIVLPTTDKRELDAALAGLRSGGGSAPHLGAAWAWYLLSPRWADVLPWPQRPPAAYADTVRPSSGRPAAVRKSVVLLADGVFDTQFCDGSGGALDLLSAIPDAASPQLSTPIGACLAPNGASARQLAALCEAIKAVGISLFTIAFPLATADQSVLEACASDRQSFYRARNRLELFNAFRDITLRLTTMLMAR